MQNQPLTGDELHFTSNLDDNIEQLKAIFAGDNTFVTRIAECRSNPSLRCAVFFLDGMTSGSAINDSILRPILEYTGELPKTAEVLARRIVQINDCAVQPDPSAMLNSFLYGDTIIFMDGDSRPLVVNTKGFTLRSAGEPDNERVLQGPREGFTEGFMTNLSMIRRRLRTPDLKFTFQTLGTKTKTTVALCYIKNLCEESIVEEWKKRLASYELDSLLDANYISESLRDSRFSPFPTLGVTERPDVVAARLLEGQAVLMVDGTPVALSGPYTMQQCFQANDDYYRSFFYVALARIMRYIGLMLSVCIPALYVSLLLYHPEIIPTRLLFAIAAARQGVPLPTLFETILLLLIFEVLKEAGTRTPGAIGQTMSIVGGLVLGQSAVSARFISAPVVIVVAVAGVLGLLVPKLTTAAMVCRFFLLVCGSVLGLYGVFFGCAVILSYLCGLQSFGVPYLLNLLPRTRSHQQDAYFRAPWFRMKKSGRYMAQEEGEA